MFDKTKNNIFIDFECISSPYFYGVSYKEKFKLPENELPIAYTLGMYNTEGEFQYETEIFDFEINEKFANNLKSSLLRSIKKIKKDIVINKSIFWAFEKGMEEKILKYVFGNDCKVEEFSDYITSGIDVPQNSRVSIKELSQRFRPEPYFVQTRATLQKANDENLIRTKVIPLKALMSKDGVFASYLCFWIYLSKDKRLHKKNNRFTKEFIIHDKEIVLKELTEYSQGDVLRMDYIHKNIVLIRQIYTLTLDARQQRDKIEHSYRFYKSFHHNLQAFAGKIKENKTLEQVNKMLESTNFLIKSVEKQFLEIKDQKKNIIAEELAEKIRKLK